MLNAPRRILRATPPAAGPHSRGVGCGVLAVLCWLGWLAGLGWAGDAGKDEFGQAWLARSGWLGLPLYFLLFLLVVVSLVVFKHLYVVFDAMFELWFTLGFHFGPFWHLWGTIWSTRGFPGQLCAHLLGCSEPQGPKCMQKVVSQPQRCHFRGRILALFCIFFKKNECVESVGSQVVFSALFRGSRDRLSLHPLQPAQSNHSFSCSVSP